MSNNLHLLQKFDCVPKSSMFFFSVLEIQTKLDRGKIAQVYNYIEKCLENNVDIGILEIFNSLEADKIWTQGL